MKKAILTLAVLCGIGMMIRNDSVFRIDSLGNEIFDPHQN